MVVGGELVGRGLDQRMKRAQLVEGGPYQGVDENQLVEGGLSHGMNEAQGVDEGHGVWKGQVEVRCQESEVVAQTG